MPRGYELTSYYDAQRAMQRKIYSKEIKRLSGAIKDFGYLNNNLYGLVISSLNNGIDDNLGEFTYDMHHISNSDIGVNQSSRLQDFMSPLELRLNSMAVRRAYASIIKLGSRATVAQMQDACYRAGQNVALEFQNLKRGEHVKGVFSMRLDSPVLSTVPIVKKYDKALVKGNYPDGEPLVYSDVRKEERKILINQNKIVFNEIKDELTRLGIVDIAGRKTAFKMLNLGYYYIEDPKTSHLELSAFLITKDNLEDKLYHSELGMNLEKLTMAKNLLKTFDKGASTDKIYSSLYQMGYKARHLVTEKYGMFPEMFTGFYKLYSEAEKIHAIKKEQETEARKMPPNKVNKPDGRNS